MNHYEYEKLITKRASKLGSQEKQVRFLIDWFLNEWEYDYLLLDMVKNDAEITNIAIKTSIEANKTANGTNIITALRIAKRCSGDTVDKAIKFLSLQPEDLILKAQELLAVQDRLFLQNITRKNMALPLTTGVCIDFAKSFERMCNELNIPCKTICGTMTTGDITVRHAWNALLINNNVKFVDISGCIHNRDEHKNPHEHVLLTYNQLCKIDEKNGKQRFFDYRPNKCLFKKNIE